MIYDDSHFAPAFAERPEPRPDAYARRSDATWTLVRHDYLAGASAGVICERYGVGLSALRRRARDEGWRRSDQPDREPWPVEEADDLDPDPGTPAELAELAWSRLSAAVRAGRLRDAAGWERLHRNLARLAAAEAKAHDVHDVHGVSETPPPAPAPDPRAEAEARELDRITRDALSLTRAVDAVIADPDDPAAVGALEALMAERQTATAQDVHDVHGVFPPGPPPIPGEVSRASGA